MYASRQAARTVGCGLELIAGWGVQARLLREPMGGCRRAGAHKLQQATYFPVLQSQKTSRGVRVRPSCLRAAPARPAKPSAGQRGRSEGYRLLNLPVLGFPRIIHALRPNSSLDACRGAHCPSQRLRTGLALPQ